MRTLSQALLWFVVLVLVGCNGQSAPTPEVDSLPVIPASDVSLDEFMTAADSGDYLSQISYSPQDAQFFDLVNSALNLTPEELAMMEQNGFVVSDRLAFEDFVHAYAWIYWQDLPVFITTDSMLQAVHETYSDMLMRMEDLIIRSTLDDMLARTREELQAGADCGGEMQTTCDDLEVYLSVAISLLRDEPATSLRAQAYIDMIYGRTPQTGMPPTTVPGATPDIPATATALAILYNSAPTATPGLEDVTLFGGSRPIDFSLFTPRGHYAESYTLGLYFRAMMWLALMDFRMLDYDELGNPVLNPTHIAGAALLRDTLDNAGMRPVWEQMDSLFGLLFGRSDNTTLPDLDRFLSDAGINAPVDALHADPQMLTTLLMTNDYGQQRITGQIQTVAPGNHDPIPHPVSFMLLGQRFSIDSYIMSNLVYDRLLVDGSNVARPFPSPLDVMYVLGNDRAATHLDSELTTYGYQGNLDALRQTVDDLSPEFWSSTSYNLWMNAIRTLSPQTTAENYPQSMRTEAWADRTLQTQLGSWAQLRHDTLLYVEQSFTVQMSCQYPAGYVEPYPAFYAALANYAQAGADLMSNLGISGLSEDAQTVLDTAITYFNHLESVSLTMQGMAEKELHLEPFSAEEEAFIRDTAVFQTPGMIYPVIPDEFTGWYAQLFPWEDDSPAVVADVHTNTAELIPPTGVLHVATGNVVANVFIADTDEGPTIYVGPSFTYYEFIEEGMPPTRLNDETWRTRLSEANDADVPTWTSSFRLTSQTPQILRIDSQ